MYALDPFVASTINQAPVSYLIPINLDILIFACLFELFLSLDTIHHKNNILLFSVCICNACSFGYSVIQFLLMRGTTARLFKSRFSYPTLVDSTRNVWPQVQPAEILVCIVTELCALFLGPIAYLIHRDYSWAIYKSVRGSPDTRMRYLAYEVFLILRKLNLYFLIGVIIQYDLVYVHFKEPEYTLTILLIPVAIIAIFLGVWFVQRERTFGANAIVIVILSSANTAGKSMMLFFAVLSLALAPATVVCTAICITIFNRGLTAINQSKSANARDSYLLYNMAPSAELSPGNSRPYSRLTLD
ncbi:hypothetical protein BO83DRAFT_403387 [Aspergillus eucalypticola CBS 122712]|uniref:Uncharacterized protein n=1 Tax=Aspergillus eucalypticola (strain CBS 122712 / IBT 29274) TaxID=1448314 RepID=A0A317UM58_ASPEC|nr:uncharacterized protein BO83DRAFT_403387 [Aspergillus eucalypticola CBS 122712]PWY63053.1 hypothetical protein BO83DRAFT_403387 [Aspergillus eucalypticola CBS 122712]